MAQPSGEKIPNEVPVEETQGFTAPIYNGSGKSPELQVMDKRPQDPPTSGAQAVTKVPSGFEFLRGHRQFFVEQRFEKMEALADAMGCCCVEYTKRYDVSDIKTKQPLLFVKEKKTANACIRCCCKRQQPVTLNVYDVTQGNPKEIEPTMTVVKPFKLSYCSCCNICSQTQTAVLTSGNKPVGSAKKHVPCGGCFKPQVSARVFALEVYFDLYAMLYYADRSDGCKWSKRWPYQRSLLLCWRPD